MLTPMDIHPTLALILVLAFRVIDSTGRDVTITVVAYVVSRVIKSDKWISPAADFHHLIRVSQDRTVQLIDRCHYRHGIIRRILDDHTMLSNSLHEASLF